MLQDPLKVMALQRFTQTQLSIGIQKVIEKIDKSRNRFHILIIVKVHGLSKSDSMVIKTDEIKAEMVNYTRRSQSNAIERLLSINKTFPP